MVFLERLHLSFFTATSTEVTETVHLYDESLGIKIGLPVLVCHSKDIGYEQVLWFKDSVLLRNGSSDASSHHLSLKELLQEDPLSTTVKFDNPLTLQGYYWCETNQMKGPTVHRYLFRIEG